MELSSNEAPSRLNSEEEEEEEEEEVPVDSIVEEAPAGKPISREASMETISIEDPEEMISKKATRKLSSIEASRRLTSGDVEASVESISSEASGIDGVQLEQNLEMRRYLENTTTIAMPPQLVVNNLPFFKRETQVIQDIIETVAKILNGEFSSVNKDLVGMDSRVTPRLWRSLFRCCLSPKERSESTTFLQPPESLSGLISLRTLDLSSCNLPDGAIPVDIGCLSSLESLDLSENNFTTLPDSICELSQLRELRLNRCGNLKSLPALPSSIKYVHVHECASLETPSNDDHKKWTSSNGGFSTTICQTSDHTNKQSKLMVQVPISDDYIQSLIQKYFEDDIYQRTECSYLFCQVRIPDWGSNNSSIGSHTTIQLPLHLASDRFWLGFALCFIYVQEGDDKSNHSDHRLVELVCHFVTDKGEIAHPLALPVVLDYNSPIYGACKFIPREWFGRQLDNASRIRVSVSSDIPTVKVKTCSSWVIYEHNVGNLDGNEISKIDVDKVAEECQPMKHVVVLKSSEQADQNSGPLHLVLLPIGEGACSTSESSTNNQSRASELANQLRRRLQFVLARLFKEGYTGVSTFLETFPVRAVYPLFSQQSVPVWEER
ncbi:hypothetical protein TIFTF001_008397 [Ficus carica]|uniref:Disease resistance protein RPS4B/Roq1-like leucine-rich repeats domain-containing protein n=1 Tax=Ficus carica TaxID=3494 RepID=A0AA87ZT01_FICCA|nr:hypothetical protein TIFTF001_008397 [Ficus carica]